MTSVPRDRQRQAGEDDRGDPLGSTCERATIVAQGSAPTLAGWASGL